MHAYVLLAEKIELRTMIFNFHAVLIDKINFSLFQEGTA